LRLELLLLLLLRWHKLSDLMLWMNYLRTKLLGWLLEFNLLWYRRCKLVLVLSRLGKTRLLAWLNGGGTSWLVIFDTISIGLLSVRYCMRLRNLYLVTEIRIKIALSGTILLLKALRLGLDGHLARTCLIKRQLLVDRSRFSEALSLFWRPLFAWGRCSDGRLGCILLKFGPNSTSI
jgi:hypothetical protein